jgi:short subunit dehydrogenase-like uncharacterized protein
MQDTFLLYGANGYTGKLIIQAALEKGLKPVIAGRNAEQIRTLATNYGLYYRVFDLSDEQLIIEAIKEYPLVLHAAGPFKFTAEPMMRACIKAGVHYLDITGEITVFELGKKMNEIAKQENVMIMSGVGFDVVPTDSLALFLAKKLPSATHLQLAFATLGGFLSHGTAATMNEGMGDGGVVRLNGKLVKKPLGHKSMTVDFGIKKIFVMTIPWGDISTAYTTTGIPNIETFTRASTKTVSLLKWQWLFNWILKLPFVKKYQLKKIKSKPEGPDKATREKATTLVWGKVWDDKGVSYSATLSGPEGYALTAMSSVLIVEKVLKGNVKPGYQTPAGCYGEDLVMEIPGVTRKVSE